MFKVKQSVEEKTRTHDKVTNEPTVLEFKVSFFFFFLVFLFKFYVEGAGSACGLSEIKN